MHITPRSGSWRCFEKLGISLRPGIYIATRQEYLHCGILLPVLCWLFVQVSNQDQWSPRDGYLVVTPYLLVANDPRITNLAADVPVINLIQSCFFAGVLLLMSILWVHVSLLSGPKSEEATLPVSKHDDRLGAVGQCEPATAERNVEAQQC